MNLDLFPILQDLRNTTQTLPPPWVPNTNLYEAAENLLTNKKYAHLAHYPPLDTKIEVRNCAWSPHAPHTYQVILKKPNVILRTVQHTSLDAALNKLIPLIPLIHDSIAFLEKNEFVYNSHIYAWVRYLNGRTQVQFIESPASPRLAMEIIKESSKTRTSYQDLPTHLNQITPVT